MTHKPVYLSALGSKPETIMAALKAAGCVDIKIKPSKRGLPWRGTGRVDGADSVVSAPYLSIVTPDLCVHPGAPGEGIVVP